MNMHVEKKLLQNFCENSCIRKKGGLQNVHFVQSQNSFFFKTVEIQLHNTQKPFPLENFDWLDAERTPWYLIFCFFM